MKKFIKQMIEFYCQTEKDSIAFEQFKKDNYDLVSSFNNEVHNKDNINNSFSFSSHNARIKKFSKKHRTYELSCPFFKDGEELGTANIFIIMEPTIKSFEKIFENNFRIIGLYIKENQIGCIFENKKGELDFFVAETLIEMITVKDVIVDIVHLED